MEGFAKKIINCLSLLLFSGFLFCAPSAPARYRDAPHHLLGGPPKRQPLSESQPHTSTLRQAVVISTHPPTVSSPVSGIEYS